jgi:hypothetical protein
MKPTEAAFWRLVESRNESHQGLLTDLEKDTEDRAAEAHALMDAAEYRSCSPQAREELLRGACALLKHAPTQSPAITSAVERLLLLLPSEEE